MGAIFFKQKTAYEMRISDWSSDVCSSDLKKAMSYDLINRKDQRIDTIFKGLENMERMIDAIRTAPRLSLIHI